MSPATAATAPRHMPLRDPRGVYSRQGGTTMSEPQQLFSASLAQYAVWKPGLRSFMEYRDLGVERATHGKFRAHVIRIKKDAAGDHALHTTGLHKHECDFQMFYVLRAGSGSSTGTTASTRSAPATASCSHPGSCTMSSTARTTSRSWRSTRPPCIRPSWSTK